MLIYQGLLWQQVTDEKELKTGAQLPPLLLIVLYNGVSPWSAAKDTRKLIALPPNSPRWPWQPKVRYHLLDLEALPGHRLARRTSLAALLFRLEQRLSFGEFQKLSGKVADWFRQHPDHTELDRLFTELVHRVSTRLGVIVPKSESTSVFRSNLDVRPAVQFAG